MARPSPTADRDSTSDIGTAAEGDRHAPDGARASSTWLAASAVGAYLLVVAGATAAVSDAVRTCGTWPVCRGPLLSDASLAVARGHRLLAVLVGVLVLATAVRVLRSDADVRVRATVAGVALLYPLQIAFGAFLVTASGATPLPSIHLATGLAIFGGLVAALAWQLRAETPADHGAGTRSAGGEPLATAAADGETTDSADAPGPTDEVGSDGLTRQWPRPVLVALAYVRLTKPRLMWLLCLVAAAGMALAAGFAETAALTGRTVLLTLGGGVLAIGASGTFNHVLERDVDKRMNRTADRPVATHRIPVRNAVAFGGMLAAAALTLFWQVNVLAAGLGLTAIVFYSVVYTLVLKPNTVQNTVIGGFAGALPALIGWAAVTGRVALPGLALAGVVFLWTPAHFYNLAMAYREDYARGGFPMMPVVHGDAHTRQHVVYYLGATLVAAGALTAVEPLGVLYGVTTVALGAVFLWAVVRLHRERTDAAAFRAFHASNAYLGAILVAVVVDGLVV